MNPCAPHPPCPECWSHRRHWRSPGSCAVVSVCRPDSWYTCCPALPQKPALPDSLAVWLSDGFRGPEGPAEQQGAEWQGWTTSSPLPPCFDARVWEGWDASLTTAAMCRGGQRVLPWAGALLEFHWLSSSLGSRRPGLGKASPSCPSPVSQHPFTVPLMVGVMVPTLPTTPKQPLH